MLAFFKHAAVCMDIMTESLTYLPLIFFSFSLKQPRFSVDPALFILLATVPTEVLYERPAGVLDPLSFRWLTSTFQGNLWNSTAWGGRRLAIEGIQDFTIS